MAALYHVNGTATLYVGSGTGGSVIGIAGPEGVGITLSEYFNEINSDERGPNIPSEVLRNGETAMIEFELWKYDTAVLNSLLTLREGGTQGKLGTVGQLMFTNSLTFGMTIASPIDGVNWYFPRCWIIDDASVKLSTQLKIWNLKIKAVPGVATDGTASSILYQFV